MLQGNAVGNTSKTGHSTSPAAKICGRIMTFVIGGKKTVACCTLHAPDGMVDVTSRKSRTEGCGKVPSIGVVGTKTVEHCAQYALDGMVDVKSSKCKTEGCGMRPSFGVAGTKTVK